MKAKTLAKILITLTALVLLAFGLVLFYLGDSEEEDYAAVPVEPPIYGESSFVVFGDPRIGETSILGQFLYPEKLSSVIDQVNVTGAAIAFVTGDFYWGDPNDEEDSMEQADEFLEAMADLNAEWYPIMGNHEAEGLGWAVARDKVFGGQSTYYSFDYGDSHFIILDAYMPGAWSSISEAQFAWLDYDLRTTAKPHIFVFLHPPLYPTGPHLGKSLDADIEVRDRLAALLAEHRVDAVFCAHEHFYCSFEYRGLVQVTTGGAGAQPLYSSAELEDLEEKYGYTIEEITRYKAVRAFHYVVVHVNGYDVQIEAYDLDGLLIDQFSFTSERALSPVP